MGLAACNALSGVDDLGGPSPADGGVVSDGQGVSPHDSSAVDGSIADSEGGANDGTFCQQHASARFCEDFEGDNPQSSWAKDVTGAGSSLAITDGAGANGSRGLDAVVTTSGASVVRAAALLKDIGASPDRVRFSYSLWVEERPSVAQYELCILSFVGANTTQTYLTLRSAGGDALGEQGVDSHELPINVTIAPRTWVRVAITVDFTGGALKIDVDAIERLAIPLLYLQRGAIRVAAGITYANAAGASGHVIVDDVLVEALP